VLAVVIAIRPAWIALTFSSRSAPCCCRGLTLPWLIHRLGVRDPAEAERGRAQRRAANAAAADAARHVFARFVAHPPDGIDPVVVERAAERATVDRDPGDATGDPATIRAIVGLTRDVLSAQRGAVIDGLRTGELDDEAAREVLDQIDLDQAALTSRAHSRW